MSNSLFDNNTSLVQPSVVPVDTEVLDASVNTSPEIRQFELIRNLIEENIDKAEKLEIELAKLRNNFSRFKFDIVESERKSFSEFIDVLFKQRKDFNDLCVIFSEEDLITITNKYEEIVENLLATIIELDKNGCKLNNEELLKVAVLLSNTCLDRYESSVQESIVNLLHIAAKIFIANPSQESGEAFLLIFSSLSRLIADEPGSDEQVKDILNEACKTEIHTEALSRGYKAVLVRRPTISGIINNLVKNFISSQNLNDVSLVNADTASFSTTLNSAFKDPDLKVDTFVNMIDRLFSSDKLLDLYPRSKRLIIRKAKFFLNQQNELNSMDLETRKACELSMKNLGRLLLVVSAITTKEEFIESTSDIDFNSYIKNFSPIGVKLINIAFRNHDLECPYSRDIISVAGLHSKLRRKPAKCEFLANQVLFKLGIKSECGAFVAPYEVDMVIRGYKIAIEFNGEKYHREQTHIDSIKYKILGKRNFHVLTYQLDDNTDIKAVIKKLVSDVLEISNKLSKEDKRLNIDELPISEMIELVLEEYDNYRFKFRTRNLALNYLMLSEITRRPIDYPWYSTS